MKTRPKMNHSGSIQLDSARAMAAGLPHMLGFHPRESLVCLWLRDAALVVAQRADLPPKTDIDKREYLQAYFASAAHVQADEVAVLIVSQADSGIECLVEGLQELLPVPCRTILHIKGAQVRELVGQDHTWQWIDPHTRQEVSRGFDGPDPELSRDRIEVECDADPDAYAAMGRYAPNDKSAVRDLQHELLGHVDQVPHTQHPGLIDDRLIRDAVAQVPGRDAVLRVAASLASEPRQALLESLLRCTRATPAGFAGNIAAATGVVAWLCGDGVRANIALDRSLRDEPDNTLGLVLEGTLRMGVPPHEVAKMLCEVPWKEIVGSTRRSA